MGHLRITKRTIGNVVGKVLSASGTVEVLLAMSIFMLLGAFVIGALVFSITSTKMPNIKKSALEYASEGIEVVRYIRKSSMANIADGTYGLLKSGSEWTLVASPESVATGYSRTITITTLGTGRSLITSAVTWTDSGTTGTETLHTILTNWQDTLITTPWVTPAFRNYYSLGAITYDIYGLRFLGSTLYTLQQNGTTATYLTTYDVTNPSSFVQKQQLTAVAYSRAWQYYTGSRLYVVNGSSTQEIVGINTPSSTTNAVYASFDMAGTHDASGIDVVGNILYVTKLNGTPEFSIIRDNNTILSTSYTLLGSYNAANSLFDVAVRGNYAYVAHGVATSDLLVLNITTPATPTLAATINTAAGATTRRLEFWNQYLFIFTSDVGLLIYDCTTPTAPTLKASFATGGAINDFVIDQARSLVFLVTANVNSEFQVVDVSNIAAPVLRGSYNAAIVTSSIALDTTNDRVYIGSTDNNNHFLILNSQ